MKVSEVTIDDLKDYLRIDYSDDCVDTELTNNLASAKAYIKSYTAMDDDEIDNHEDITEALFVLVADFFDNKNYYIEGKANQTNKTVDCILGMHSLNGL